MCRNLIQVNEKTLPLLLNKMNTGKKCLIINTAQTPVEANNPLAYFGARGFALPDSKTIATETLGNLMKIPENCGKVFCEIV